MKYEFVRCELVFVNSIIIHLLLKQNMIESFDEFNENLELKLNYKIVVNLKNSFTNFESYQYNNYNNNNNNNNKKKNEEKDIKTKLLDLFNKFGKIRSIKPLLNKNDIYEINYLIEFINRCTVLQILKEYKKNEKNVIINFGYYTNCFEYTDNISKYMIIKQIDKNLKKDFDSFDKKLELLNKKFKNNNNNKKTKNNYFLYTSIDN
jgi:hypothetical protein